jgi:hypothetical protein
MSEEYCKSACQECNGRISLPVDAVGVEFNCPHCGVNLQLVLKHYCEHCNGPLSFDGNPDAIGMEIECGHCKNQTVLQPSALVIEDKAAAEEEEEEVYEEEFEEDGDGSEEEYDEEYEEEDQEEAEPEPERGGPPKPRQPKRGGPPKPRQPKKVRQRPGGGGATPGDAPEKIGRRLAGAGAKPAEEESEEAPAKGGRPGRPKPGGRRGGRPKPKRRTRPDGESQSAVPSAPMTRRQPAAAPEESMDPMAGAVPGGSSAPPPNPAGPQPPGPVVRKVAGVIPGAGGGAHSDAQSSGTPKLKSSFNKKSKDEEKFDGPWYKNSEKQKLAVVVTVFALSFTYFGLPSLAGLIDKSWEQKVERIVKLKFLFGDGYRKNNVAESIKVDQSSLLISRGTGPKTEGQQGPNVFYVTGSAQNITSDTLEQVEIIFKLYDQSGAELGEAFDYTNQLGPNVVWNFRALCNIREIGSTNIFRANLDRLIVR